MLIGEVQCIVGVVVTWVVATCWNAPSTRPGFDSRTMQLFFFFFFNFWRTESVAGGQSGNNRNNTGMNRRAHCRRNKNGRNILMCYNYQASLLLRLATLLNFGSRRHRCRQSGAIQVVMLPLDSEAALGDLGTTAL